jgi:hypothetical protein
MHWRSLLFWGVSCGGDEQGFLDLLCDIEEGHKREGVFADDGGSVVKSKGWNYTKDHLRRGREMYKEMNFWRYPAIIGGFSCL